MASVFQGPFRHQLGLDVTVAFRTGVLSAMLGACKRKFYGGEVAKSRLLVSPWFCTAKFLPDTLCSIALTLVLTLYKLHRGTNLVACQELVV